MNVSADSPSEGRLSQFLFAGWLLLWLSLQVSDLPVKLLLKNHFQLGAADIAIFGLVTGIAWYTKPLCGWLSDSVRFFGTRRRHYLLLSSTLSGIVWCALAVLPLTYGILLGALILINAGKTLSNAVLGGILVDTGHRFGTTGRLSSQRSAVTSAVTLISGPVAGFLAGKAFGWAALASALCAFLLGAACYRFLPEAPTPRPEKRTGGSPNPLRELLRSRSLWWGLLMSFLFMLAPGFGTPLLFLQQDTLRFSPQLIGNLALLNGAAGLVGALVYGYLCHRVALRPLLVGGTLASVGAILCFLRYDTLPHAVLVTLATGFTGALATLPVADLTARATPRGNEALGFSLMVSASNVAWKFSDVLGSWLYQHKHFHFPQLVLLNAGTTLCMLLVLPLVPRSLTDKRL
ncbi:MFS transporter [Armatimonas rosea]|uniref:Putative MFS family arabinose efflux permease n=1 Tax=Armatimonas rosea TaxID=685828 RepID=A0A7W9SPX7_ARMRO|nr:MFS transporter [Armatimonas rosea]MBB6050651.1 putative MFS family arabinose efflux permease [Armatimonas rosea]